MIAVFSSMAGDPALPPGGAELPPAPPSWLKPERFQDAKFNPEDVVADLRRHVSGHGLVRCRGHGSPPSRSSRMAAALGAARRVVLRATRTPPQVPLTVAKSELQSYLATLREQVRRRSHGCARPHTKAPPEPLRLRMGPLPSL